MIDWTQPIETVPDERNPKPVPCEKRNPYSAGFECFIYGAWVDFEGEQRGDDVWSFDHQGDSCVPFLPNIRNVEQN